MSSPAARRLRWFKRRWHLTLTPVLEVQFQRARREAHVPSILTAVCTAFALLGLYLLADFFTRGRFLHLAFLGPVLLAAAVPAMVGVIAMLRRRGHGFPLWWVALPAATNALCWAVLPAIGAALKLPWPYEIMLFNFLYTFFFLAIPVPIAAAIGGGSALTFALLQSVFAPHDWSLFSKIFIVFGFVVHGIAAAALLERNERRSWLARRRLAELAQRDSLTGLFNRRTFFERADVALRQARRSGAAVALLLIDADHFKRFNDTHGHPAGDACLRRLAGVLTRFAQRPLDVVARIGGEEFALLFFDAPQAWAVTRTEELRDAVRALHGENLPCTTVSIGIATDLGGASLTTLLQRADTALYRAKAAGRDRVSE